MGVDYLPGRVLVLLLVEHSLIAALGLLSLTWPGPAGPSVAILAFGTVGLVISSIAFAYRWRLARWARAATAFGLLAAAIVSGYAGVVLFILVRDVTGPCDPSSSECEGFLGLEGFVMSLALVCVVYLAFLGVLAAHWGKSLRRGT